MEIKWPTLVGGIARRRSIFKFAAKFETDHRFSDVRGTAGVIPSSRKPAAS
jgi:hypothetical protein